MTKTAQNIDTAPEKTYPDRGCASWPSCLDCPFDPCINTADKDPTALERERAVVRREIIRLHQLALPNKHVAAMLRTEVGTVERGLAKYRVDQGRARSKTIELERETLVLEGRPTLEVTT